MANITLSYFAVSNARRFYSSMGKLLSSVRGEKLNPTLITLYIWLAFQLEILLCLTVCILFETNIWQELKKLQTAHEQCGYWRRCITLNRGGGSRVSTGIIY